MKKKSLIESLKSTKKANLMTAPAKNEGSSTRKTIARKSAAGRRAALARQKM
jgi:hypothetical protein